MNVLFFPDNKLSASIEPIFNGHTAIVSANTDRLIDGKYALAEKALFKHNVQGTSFLNPLGDSAGENINYGTTLQDVHATGRISYGVYWRTDRWVNPISGASEAIPDYSLTTWTAAGAAVFSGAAVGAAKAARYPNHGQQMFDVSGGAFGYDMVNQIMGASNLSETYIHNQQQVSKLESLSGVHITSGSYANGAQGAWNVLIPKLMGARNSFFSSSGDGNIEFLNLNRTAMMQEASTTRTWDAVNDGSFSSQSDSLLYSHGQIQRAVELGGWYSDFMHWHSVYNVNDTAFFDTYFAMVDNAIGASDVWRAGNNEVNEYSFTSRSINKIGSYMDGNRGFVFLRMRDYFTGTNTNGIQNTVDLSKISTPISIKINLTGTALAGYDIQSEQAVFVRKLGGNQWIINVRPVDVFKNGYMAFSFKAATSVNGIYTTNRPVLTRIGNQVTANMPCDFVVWRKGISEPDSAMKAVHRTSALSTLLNYQFDTAGYLYVVGGINQSRQSAAIEF